MAKLYFRYGVMNSGKTTAIMQVAHNYAERGMQAVVLKPSTDTKGQHQIVSRLGLTQAVDILLAPDDTIEQAMQAYPDCDCLLVDEAQFLTPKQAEELFWFATKHDTPVIAYGLRTDFQTVGFPGATRLLELAHEVQELKTICLCGKKATLNARRHAGKFVFEGNKIAIDGEADVQYESLCASCYLKFKTAAQ